MSSSSEGRAFPVAVIVVAVVVVPVPVPAAAVAAAAAAVDAALFLSLPSLTATLLQGVAEPDDRPLVLLPVLGKMSILERESPRTGV